MYVCLCASIIENSGPLLRHDNRKGIWLSSKSVHLVKKKKRQKTVS